MEEIYHSVAQQLEEERRRRIAAVQTMAVAEKSNTDLKERIKTEEQSRKSAEAALKGAETQAESQRQMVVEVKGQLVTAKEQIATLRQQLDEANQLKALAEKARAQAEEDKLKAEKERDEAEQHGYDIGVAETEDTLRAEVPAVCRAYCAQTWEEALNQAGVEASSRLRKPDSIIFPSALRILKFPTEAIPFPQMGGMLASGQIAAATLPEPFASQAEQQYGAVPLADLNQGATTDFPIEGYVVTKQWAAQYPNTLKRFLAALEIGQEVADTDRSAVEQSFEAINGPQNGQVTPGIAAVMALDTYPIGVDATRIQRVADVMFQFGLLKTQFNVNSMLLPSSFFNFSQFSSSGS